MAIFTAVQIANRNIRDSFNWTVRQIAGNGEIEVVGNGEAFDEEIIRKIREIPGIREARPVLLQTLTAEGTEKEEIVILGSDLIDNAANRSYDLRGTESPPGLQQLLEPGTILVTPFLAGHFGLKPGSILTLRLGGERIRLNVAGTISFRNDLPPPYGGYFAVMDIAGAQLLFHQIGKLSRINVVLEKGASIKGVREKLGAAVAGLRIQSPEEEEEIVEQLLGSFNLNIRALSEISILVGMFLIYNTLSLMVARRKVEIGILRTIGVESRSIFQVVLLEAALIGLTGSVIGLLFGFLVSKFVLKAVSLTISSLYLKAYTESVSFPPAIALIGLSVGVSVSVLAAAFPAWEASRVAPRENLAGDRDSGGPYRVIGFTATGAVLLMSSFFLAKLPAWHGMPLFGYLSAFLVLAGSSFLIPAALFLFFRMLRSPLFNGRFLLFKTAGSGFFHRSGRNAIGIAALTFSVALLISVTIMIQSFRKTLEVWFDQTVRADMILEKKEDPLAGESGLVDPGTAEQVRKIPGVSAIDRFREENLLFNNRPFQLNARDLAVHLEKSRFLVVGGATPASLRNIEPEREALISESFSLQHRLQSGDTFVLPTPSGPLALRIKAVFYDYTTHGGRVVIDRGLYQKYWKEDRFNLLAIYLERSAGLEATATAVRNYIRNLPGNGDFSLTSNAEIRKRVMEIFDQTFSITRVLEWVTILISLLGVINLLLANLLDRKREIGILRSIGMSGVQVGALTLLEGFWIALVANMIGSLAGTALSMILIFVINKQSFYWTIQPAFSGSVYARIFFLVSFSAFCASFFPALKASEGEIRQAIQYE